MRSKNMSFHVSMIALYIYTYRTKILGSYASEENMDATEGTEFYQGRSSIVVLVNEHQEIFL